MRCERAGNRSESGERSEWTAQRWQASEWAGGRQGVGLVGPSWIHNTSTHGSIASFADAARRSAPVRGRDSPLCSERGASRRWVRGSIQETPFPWRARILTQKTSCAVHRFRNSPCTEDPRSSSASRLLGVRRYARGRRRSRRRCGFGRCLGGSTSSTSADVRWDKFVEQIGT